MTINIEHPLAAMVVVGTVWGTHGNNPPETKGPET